MMNSLKSSPSSFSIEHISSNYIDHDQLQLQPLGTNLQVDSSSSSSSASYRFFIDQTGQDHARYYHQPHDHHQDDANLHYETIKKSTVNIGLKLRLWKKDDHEPSDNINMSTRDDPVKWMSSKMRLMQKMKNSDCNLAPKRLRSDNQKLQSFSSVETDHHSSSNGSSPNNNNIINSPIRVCADCNTTKTPLWRSGPKGPKSLCNACGIRQRKARRAMAAAAANGMSVACDRPPTIKFKVPHKDKNITTGKNGHSSHISKRCKIANYNDNVDAANIGSTSNEQINKMSKLEDFLIKLSNNLAVHRVFPQDEKDAAILLMALSSGLVHG